MPSPYNTPSSSSKITNRLKNKNDFLKVSHWYSSLIFATDGTGKDINMLYLKTNFCTYYTVFENSLDRTQRSRF